MSPRRLAPKVGMAEAIYNVMDAFPGSRMAQAVLVEPNATQVTSRNLELARQTGEWMRAYHQRHADAAERRGIKWRVPRVYEVRQCSECSWVYAASSVTPKARREECPLCKGKAEVLPDSTKEETDDR